MRRYRKIKRVSDVRRLPRLGKIRMGIKRRNANGKEYPAETDYFVCPPEVRAVYGDEPKELPIMFPLDDEETVAPQAYEMYGRGKGLYCIGDGETAERKDDDGNWIERECPCPFLEEGKCKQSMHLSFLIPEVSVGGVYQLDTSSYHSIVDINSGIDYVRGMIGRLAMVPLKLIREPRETHHNNQRQTHYTLRLELAVKGTDTISQLRADTRNVLSHTQALSLPSPEQRNPAFDDEGTTVDETTGEVIDGHVTEPENESQESQMNKDQILEWVESCDSVDTCNAAIRRLGGADLTDDERKEVMKAIRKRIHTLTGKNEAA